MKIVIFDPDTACREALLAGQLGQRDEIVVLPRFAPEAPDVTDALLGADILVFGPEAAGTTAAIEYVKREIPPRISRVSSVLVALPTGSDSSLAAWEGVGFDDVILGPLQAPELELRLNLAIERLLDRRATQFLERAINNTPDAILITKADPNNQEIIYANAGFEEMTGYTSAEIAGRTPHFLQGSKTNHQARSRLRQAITEGRGITEELTNYRKNGTSFQIELSLAPIYSGGDRPSHYIGVQREMGSRPGTTLPDVDQDHVPGEILQGVKEAVLAMDEEGRVTYLNQAMARCLSAKSQDLLGGSIHQAIPGYDGSLFQKKFQQVRDEKHHVTFNAQFEGISAWYEIHAFPSPHGLVVSCRDISAMRQSDQIFSLLKAAVDALDESIVITDSQIDAPGPRILYANEAHCRLTGYQFAEMIGQSPRMFQGPKTDTKVLERVRRKMLAGLPVTVETVNYRKDGSEYVVQWNVSPIRDGNGDITNFISVQRDMTTRLREQEELMQSRKLQAVGELAGGIAHEFNNLLSPMVIQTERILERYRDDETLREAIHPVQQAIHQASALCRRILMLSHKDEEKKALVSLNELVAETVELLKRTIDRRIAIHTELDENLIPLVLSRVQIFQVLMNLIINARDTLLERLAHQTLSAGDWEPRLTISTDTAKPNSPASGAGSATRKILPCQRIIVSDNGMGMSEQTRGRLFEPFFTTKDPGTGTGLGLATAWNIIQSLDGWLEVESYQGEGSSFSVYLPISPDALRTESEKQNSDTQPLPKVEVSKKSILLVDDNELLCTTLSRLLEREGHTVTKAMDGHQALKHMVEEPERFDLVITDQNLPKLSGLDLIAQLREKGRHLPIVLMSGFLSEKTRSNVTEFGVSSILDKPVTPTDLLEAIAQASEPTPP